MGNLQIDILGTSFALQANEEDEYLNKIYEYYKSIVRQVDNDPKLKDPLKKAIISGIMICDELCKSKQKLEYIVSLFILPFSTKLSKTLLKLIKTNSTGYLLIILSNIGTSSTLSVSNNK